MGPVPCEFYMDSDFFLLGVTASDGVSDSDSVSLVFVFVFIFFIFTTAFAVKLNLFLILSFQPVSLCKYFHCPFGCIRPKHRNTQLYKFVAVTIETFFMLFYGLFAPLPPIPHIPPLRGSTPHLSKNKQSKSVTRTATSGPPLSGFHPFPLSGGWEEGSSNRKCPKQI